jgi:fatty-acyl-CoA synthase
MLYDGCTLGDLAVRALGRHPERDAVVCGDRRQTYAELRDQVARFVAAFRDAGLRPGDRIAIFSRNRPEVVGAFCAAYVQGLALTPLSPHAADDDLAFVLQDAGIDCLVVDETGLGERGAALAGSVAGVRQVFTFEAAPFGRPLCGAATDRPPEPLQSSARTDLPAVIGYTGGTTGKPKGVIQSQRGMVAAHQMMLAEWDWPESPRMLLATPLSHAAGVMILPTLMRGGAVVMLPGFEPGAFLAEIERSAVSVTFLVPTMIYALLDAVAGGPPRRLDTLRTVFYGAAPMSTERLRQAIGVFGPVFMQLYGQTEAPLCISTLRRDEHDLARPDRLSSCGKPSAGLCVALLDDHGDEVPTGEIGEICVRGALVMDSYHRRPEETAEAFRGGWLHTGDVGRFDPDGYLHIVDRCKDLIISGGLNIYPREVESVLESHAGIAQCAVVGLPDPKWGEAVTAAVVRRAGHALTEEEIALFVRSAKSPLHAPKRVVFVDRLPLTPVGKPDRAALRRQLAVAQGGQP